METRSTFYPSPGMAMQTPCEVVAFLCHAGSDAHEAEALAVVDLEGVADIAARCRIRIQSPSIEPSSASLVSPLSDIGATLKGCRPGERPSSLGQASRSMVEHDYWIMRYAEASPAISAIFVPRLYARERDILRP
jgi:hypothetical protein